MKFIIKTILSIESEFRVIKFARCAYTIHEGKIPEVNMYGYFIEKINYKLILVAHFIQNKCICPQI